MPLPSSGPISLGQVATEFGISASLAACYGIAPGVPTSGPIGLANLHGKAMAVGQIVLSSGTWTVPAGVSKVSMVTIGGSITRSGEILLSAADAIGTRNDGGGNGGAAPSKGGGGAGSPSDPYSSGAPGSNLRYRNNVAVAAGQVLSISGPCRIVWGSNRAFPSTNVGNL